MTPKLNPAAAALLFLALACPDTGGQTPATPAFTYQGQLMHNGQPFNGTANLTFALFGTATGGSVIAAETLSGVAVTDGLFTVTLNAENLWPSDAFIGEARWLEATVNGQTLSPRQRITAAPLASYALKATSAHTLGAPDGNPANAVFVANNGNVGIGSSNPQDLLHIAGGLHPDVRIQDTTPGGKTYHMGINSLDGSLRIAETDVADRLVIAANGGVGIGTANPAQKLSVDGVIQSTSGGVQFPDGKYQRAAMVIEFTQGIAGQHLDNAFATAQEVSIAVGGAGRIHVIATGYMDIFEQSFAVVGIGTARNTSPLIMTEVHTNQSADIPFTCQYVFQAPAAGTYSFYLNALDSGEGNVTIRTTGMTATFIPAN